MWHEKRLAIPANMRPITCSTVVVHPWTFGVGQTVESGVFLSPPNAVNTLAGKLAGTPANHDVVIFMITAPTIEQFITLLTAAAAVFPLPDLTQVQRRARSALSLAVTKMQRPMMAGSLPAAVPLSFSTARSASTAQAMQQAIGQASGAGMADIADALAGFAAQRQTLLAAAGETLQQLQGMSVPIWALEVSGSVETALLDMREDIPNPDAVLTLCMMFVGEDLGPLREMVTER
ncbi:hypothetical protein WCU81_02115 [Pectobacterium atrosepticum]|uniref:hypothetical protein n=1 Tax=Pectobacterium atrosepticum TaxID=29471 RepID=UPI00049A549E|nr:hypothetical protein [Pectobacterium atrosepticum]AIA71403.1 hypothetical protein EV46_12580 [Pectobacterium atrosepticum]AIK13776.1 hypothetical protein GZ59_19590 [Pectobacterium atrosepticum]POW31987.1 hypothetical protein PB72LOC_00335 [Pectobacterium atrosepticum]PWD62310.1 hypothetical protein DF214_08695 [Pectobacterium atrosepticum]